MGRRTGRDLKAQCTRSHKALVDAPVFVGMSGLAHASVVWIPYFRYAFGAR